MSIIDNLSISSTEFHQGRQPFLDALHEVNRANCMRGEEEIFSAITAFNERIRIVVQRLGELMKVVNGSVVQLDTDEMDSLISSCEVHNGAISQSDWQALHACVRGDVQKVLLRESSEDPRGSSLQAFRVWEPSIVQLANVHIEAAPDGFLQHFDFTFENARKHWRKLTLGSPVPASRAVPIIDKKMAKLLMPSRLRSLKERIGAISQPRKLNRSDGMYHADGNVYLPQVDEDPTNQSSFMPWAPDVFVPRPDLSRRSRR